MDLSDVTCKCGDPNVDQREVWKEITMRMHATLSKLEERAPPNTDQVIMGWDFQARHLGWSLQA